FDSPATVRDPIKELRVMDFFAGSPSARHDENVKIGAVLDRVVGNYTKASGRDDDVGFFRDQADFKRRGLFATARLVQPGDGKDFERTTKVQAFNVWKNQYANSLTVHMPPSGSSSVVPCLSSVVLALSEAIIAYDSPVRNDTNATILAKPSSSAIRWASAADP